MSRLQGKRVAIAAQRRAEELSRLVEKLGGVPVVRPMQGTVFEAREETARALGALLDEGFDWMVFTTGMGTEALFEAAAAHGLEETFREHLGRASIAARGYKTLRALRRRELEPDVRDDDGTTRGLVRRLAPFPWRGRHVAVQLHGDRAPHLLAFLQEQGARVTTLLPYRHVPPPEEQVERLVQEVLRREVDAVAFTSPPQVLFLFDHARRRGLHGELVAAFAGATLAVAVGKVTAETLHHEGVRRLVVPSQERMGAMILALADYVAGG